jgi:[protein-PII] uridylyltransferase
MKELKKISSREKEKLFSQKKLRNNAYKFCVEYSLFVESQIYRIFSDRSYNFAVLASGSFGRRELAPHSDIQLLLVLPRKSTYDRQAAEIKNLLAECELPFSVSVSYYSDIRPALEEDIKKFTRFFETRFLFGKRAVFEQWQKKLFEVLDEENKKRLITAYVENIFERHALFGDTPKLLEPSIKETAGGLRDLQSVEWMYGIKNNIMLSDQSEKTQTEKFVTALYEQKIITRKEKKNVLENYEFLLRVRNLLHVISNRRNDRLEFRFQKEIATLLGYAEQPTEFMRRYFQAASYIHKFSRTLIKKFKEEITKPLSDYLTIDLDEDFYLKGERIFTYSRESLSFSAMMRAFYYRGFYGAIFDRHLRALISESVEEADATGTSKHLSSVFFREILKLPQHVGETLSAMNELGFLGLFLEEFNELIGFYQEGIYHYYTADEHTLRAIKNLEALSGAKSEIARLYELTERKDLLYFALLLHDIGKPISIEGHEIIGAEYAYSIGERLGYSTEEIELVAFLIRNHLLMPNIAYGKDKNRPEVLKEFSDIFPSLESLNMLYLLTYADLSAANPLVLTSWKKQLLHKLFLRTRVLVEERIMRTESLFVKEEEFFGSTDVHRLGRHLHKIENMNYFDSFTPEEIRKHAEEIEKGKNISVVFEQKEEKTDITVFVKDLNLPIARLCATLTVNDLNIISAKIFTRTDGVAINNFEVKDYRTGKPVSSEHFTKIKNDIILSINFDMEITKEFTRYRSKWKVLGNKILKKSDKIRIEFSEENHFTKINVYSPDMIGLLYTILEAFAELNLKVFLAKLETQGANVQSYFYVLNKDSTKIIPEDFELIKVTLKEKIKEILER